MPVDDPSRRLVGNAGLRHRLVAILAADAAGYSRLMSINERATLATLDNSRQVFRRHVDHWLGRVVDTAGDSVLAIFDTASGAVDAAVAIQDGLAALCTDLPDDCRMRFRIGIHLGDVFEKDDGSVYGNGVNIAARVQALATPGSISVSEAVRSTLGRSSNRAFEDQGLHTAKNIPEPVRIYRLSERPSEFKVGQAVLLPGIGVEEAQPSTTSGMPARSPARGDEVQHFGALEWRPSQRLALIDGEPADIGSRALDLLALLIAERHRVVAKQEMLDRVWPGLIVEEDNLPVHVSALRKVLGPGAVSTIPGRGYRFTLQSTAFNDPPSPRPALMERSRHTNLPSLDEVLVGRAFDVDSLLDLLGSQRLVSIVGAGGMGKTRVAQVVARNVVDRFEHGVWWVDLGALTSPEEIAPAIAAAARVQLGLGDGAAQLAAAFEARNTLIVLDNCEHLIEAASRIASSLLDAAHGLRILATSQEPLKLPAEQVFRLEALEVPAADASLADARRCGAVLLLERRARAVSRNFSLTHSSLPAAISLCRQLDGIPLAIEMAAARLPQLGAQALMAVLGKRLTWLKSGLRAAPARQQTLRAMLDWSHSLLSANEQAVLRRLGVFAGSFCLQSARRLGSGPGLDESSVDEALAALVERSLVQVNADDPPRYRLLETTRLYVHEQLTTFGEEQSTLLAHMRLMADIGAEIETAYWVQPDEEWLSRYACEYDDLHAAFVNACAQREPSCVARTLDALHRMDELQELHSPIGPRVTLAQHVLHLADPDAGLRIRLVSVGIFLTQKTVEGMSKLQAATEAVALARELRDDQRLYRALVALAVHATVADDDAARVSALLEADSVENPNWPPRLLWCGALNRSYHYALQGDAVGTMRSIRAELLHAERAGSPMQVANARLNLADASLMCGDPVESVRLGYEVVSEARSLGRPGCLTVGIANLCGALIVLGDLSAARSLAIEALALAWRDGRLGYVLDHLAALAAQTGYFEDALQMVGFTDTWWTQVQYRREGNEAKAVERAALLCNTALGPIEAAKWRRIGTRLDADAIRRLATNCVECTTSREAAA